MSDRPATVAALDAMIRRSRRTPEAQADIAAARAAPTGMEVAMQEVDRQLEQAAREVRDCAHAIRHIGCPSCDERHGGECSDLDSALSNAALADTPASRQYLSEPAEVVRGSIRACRRPGGNVEIETTHAGGLVRNGLVVIERADVADAIVALSAIEERQPYPALAPANLPPGALLLTGAEAERYRALQAAARAAQEAARAAQAASVALRDAIQQLCAGLAPGKEP